MTGQGNLIRYIFWMSAAFHFFLYALSLVAIAIGFWKLGIWHRLTGALAITVLTVLLKMAMTALSSMVITLLDPDFFSFPWRFTSIG